MRRLIVVVQGAECHNSDIERTWRVPQCLAEGDLKVEGIEVNGAEAQFKSHPQGVHYTIKVTQSKQDFRRYLQEPDVHVIYDGHARYGQGPCFGEKMHGEHWDTGRVPAREGIFRMGYRYLSVPINDIIHHRYRCTPAAFATKPAPELLHPYLRGVFKRAREVTCEGLVDRIMRLKQEAENAIDALKRKGHSRHLTPEDELAAIQDITRAELEGLLTASGYWVYDAAMHFDAWEKSPERPEHRIKLRVPHVILHADWEKTASGEAGMDLGATDLKCAVFAHFGCKSFIHNQKIVRHGDYKGWAQKRTQIAVWTHKLTESDLTPYWLYHILTFVPGDDPVYRTSAYYDVLRCAEKRTNDSLRVHGKKYQIVMG